MRKGCHCRVNIRNAWYLTGVIALSIAAALIQGPLGGALLVGIIGFVLGVEVCRDDVLSGWLKIVPAAIPAVTRPDDALAWAILAFLLILFIVMKALNGYKRAVPFSGASRRMAGN